MQPRLIDVAVPADPEGVVLVLHGGAARRGRPRVSPTQLSVLRMVPIARRVARVGARRLAVFRVLNSVRGWNADHTPVQDAGWALEQVTQRLGGELPTCLVGHSLGGRAALLSAGRPGVRGCVALAPWVYPTDIPEGLSGQRIVIVHGSADRVASPERSEALAQRLEARAQVSFVSVAGAKHGLLGHHQLADALAADFCAVTLLGAEPTGLMTAVARGDRWIDA